MEEKIMAIKIIGIIIGVLVLGAGIYYGAKEKKRSGIQKDLHDHRRGGRRYCRRVRGAAACVRHFTEKTGAGWLRFFYALQYSTY